MPAEECLATIFKGGENRGIAHIKVGRKAASSTLLILVGYRQDPGNPKASRKPVYQEVNGNAFVFL